MIISFLASIAGAALYRWRGHASEYKMYFPRPWNQLAFALPYALFCIPPMTDGWFTPLVVLLITWMFVLKGHGGFHDLGTWTFTREPESLEFLIRWTHRWLPPYWYDALGLAVTGIAVSMWAGIALGNPLLALSGALKAPAYMLARQVGWGPPAGEWLTGAFLWGSLAILAGAL